jgi:hypothetical protein
LVAERGDLPVMPCRPRIETTSESAHDPLVNPPISA